MSIFKESYRGRAIYWHGGARGYGDETNAGYRTIAECRAAIDAQQHDGPRLTDAETYFASLPPHDRELLRREYARTAETFNAYDSVADYAFARAQGGAS